MGLFISFLAIITKMLGCGLPLIREGGSIPVMATFQQVLGLPSILMGFGAVPGALLHSTSRSEPNPRHCGASPQQKGVCGVHGTQDHPRSARGRKRPSASAEGFPLRRI